MQMNSYPLQIEKNIRHIQRSHLRFESNKSRERGFLRVLRRPAATGRALKDSNAFSRCFQVQKNPSHIGSWLLGKAS